MIEVKKLTAVEKLFLLQYIKAVARDFCRLQAVLALMDEESFAVTDLARATVVAAAVVRAGIDFDAAILVLAKQNRHHIKKVAQWPPADDVADIVARSFYKTFTSHKHDKLKLFAMPSGIYSGDAASNWQHAIDTVKKISGHKPPNSWPDKKKTDYKLENDDSADDVPDDPDTF